MIDVGTLFESNYHRVLAIIRKKIGDHDYDEAEDLAQQVFIKALRTADRYEDRGVDVMAWLSTIAFSVVANHYRSRTRQRERAAVAIDALPWLEWTIPAPQDDLEGERDAALISRVQGALPYLKPYQRRVIEMNLAGYRNKEIADLWGTTQQSIGKSRFEAVQKLKQILVAA